MTTATLKPFEQTLQKTSAWMDELSSDLGNPDEQRTYRILRAVLMALRDRLPPEEATDLGAQLPMLVRGFYYEGWNPSKTPTKESHREEFLNHVAGLLQEPIDGPPEDAARAVFRLLANHITEGEVRHIKSNLPQEVQSLWPA